MLLLATVFDVIDPVLTIAAAMSVQSPFLRSDGADSIQVALPRSRLFEGGAKAGVAWNWID